MLEVPYKYRGRVVHVVDGDTLDILVDVGFNISHKIRIRLANVDTPEIYRPSCEAELEHGREASKFVKEHCYGKEVVLETYKDATGKYGRYLADIILPTGESLQELLVLNKLVKRESYECGE